MGVGLERSRENDVNTVPVELLLDESVDVAVDDAVRDLRQDLGGDQVLGLVAESLDVVVGEDDFDLRPELRGDIFGTGDELAGHFLGVFERVPRNEAQAPRMDCRLVRDHRDVLERAQHERQ